MDRDSSSVTSTEVDLESLRAWHAAYCQWDGTDWSLPSRYEICLDAVDTTENVEKVVRAAQRTRVVGGFCGKCSNMFNHWPSPTMEKHSIGRHFTTYQIEAGTHNGCRCCTLIFQQLNHTIITGESKMFDLLRRVEQRLKRVNDHCSASIAVGRASLENKDHCDIWVNFPGKNTGRGKQNEYIHHRSVAVSHGVPPHCKNFCTS